MRLRDGLIGHAEANQTLKFSGSDDLENLNKRLALEDENWYYRNVDITYKFNRYGHRCENPEDIDLDNYILFAGCSHTEGVGLELEKTYPYLVSKEFNCDYYNLGMGGTGPDTLIHNLTVWLNTFKKPKAIVVQWPFWGRHILMNFPQHDSLRAVGPWSQDNDSLSFILAGERVNYFKSVQYLAKVRIDSFNLPTVHVTSNYEGDSAKIPDYCIEFHELDRARDVHMGIISHDTLYTQIYERLIDYELKNN